jgi:hypothetical protein
MPFSKTTLPISSALNLKTYFCAVQPNDSPRAAETLCLLLTSTTDTMKTVTASALKRLTGAFEATIATIHTAATLCLLRDRPAVLEEDYEDCDDISIDTMNSVCHDDSHSE